MTRAHLQLGGVERRPRAVSSGVDVVSAKRRAMENDPGTTGADRNCPRQTGADSGIRCGAKGTISNNFFFFFKKIGTRRTEIWIWKMAGDKDVRWSEQ